MTAIDRLDARLLGLLAEDARRGVADLARRAGVTRNTVQSRIQRLERSGVIRGYRLDIDLEAAGVDVQVLVALEVVQGRIPEVVDGLAAIPEVLEVHVMTGQADLLVRVASATQSELQPVLLTIYAVPGVARSNTSLLLSSAVSYRAGPMLDAITEGSDFGRATPAP